MAYIYDVSNPFPLIVQAVGLMWIFGYTCYLLTADDDKVLFARRPPDSIEIKNWCYLKPGVIQVVYSNNTTGTLTLSFQRKENKVISFEVEEDVDPTYRDVRDVQGSRDVRSWSFYDGGHQIELKLPDGSQCLKFETDCLTRKPNWFGNVDIDKSENPNIKHIASSVFVFGEEVPTAVVSFISGAIMGFGNNSSGQLDRDGSKFEPEPILLIDNQLTTSDRTTYEMMSIAIAAHFLLIVAAGRLFMSGTPVDGIEEKPPHLPRNPEITSPGRQMTEMCIRGVPPLDIAGALYSPGFEIEEPNNGDGALLILLIPKKNKFQAHLWCNAGQVGFDGSNPRNFIAQKVYFEIQPGCVEDVFSACHVTLHCLRKQIFITLGNQIFRSRVPQKRNPEIVFVLVTQCSAQVTEYIPIEIPPSELDDEYVQACTRFGCSGTTLLHGSKSIENALAKLHQKQAPLNVDVLLFLVRYLSYTASKTLPWVLNWVMVHLMNPGYCLDVACFLISLPNNPRYNFYRKKGMDKLQSYVTDHPHLRENVMCAHGNYASSYIEDNSSSFRDVPGFPAGLVPAYLQDVGLVIPMFTRKQNTVKFRVLTDDSRTCEQEFDFKELKPCSCASNRPYDKKSELQIIFTDGTLAKLKFILSPPETEPEMEIRCVFDTSTHNASYVTESGYTHAMVTFGGHTTIHFKNPITNEVMKYSQAGSWENFDEMIVYLIPSTFGCIIITVDCYVYVLGHSLFSEDETAVTFTPVPVSLLKLSSGDNKLPFECRLTLMPEGLLGVCDNGCFYAGAKIPNVVYDGSFNGYDENPVYFDYVELRGTNGTPVAVASDAKGEFPGCFPDQQKELKPTDSASMSIRRAFIVFCRNRDSETVSGYMWFTTHPDGLWHQEQSVYSLRIQIEGNTCFALRAPRLILFRAQMFLIYGEDLYECKPTYDINDTDTPQCHCNFELLTRVPGYDPSREIRVKPDINSVAIATANESQPTKRQHPMNEIIQKANNGRLPPDLAGLINLAEMLSIENKPDLLRIVLRHIWQHFYVERANSELVSLYVMSLTPSEVIREYQQMAKVYLERWYTEDATTFEYALRQFARQREINNNHWLNVPLLRDGAPAEN